MNPDLLKLLPKKFREVVEVVGLSAAMKLSEGWPGIRFRVPKRITANHPIVLAIGITAAEKLCKRYGDDYITMPKATLYQRAVRNALLVDEYQAGKTGPELARKYGLHENHVYTVISQCEAKRQRSLF